MSGVIACHRVMLDNIVPVGRISGLYSCKMLEFSVSNHRFPFVFAFRGLVHYFWPGTACDFIRRNFNIVASVLPSLVVQLHCENSSSLQTLVALISSCIKGTDHVVYLNVMCSIRVSIHVYVANSAGFTHSFLLWYR